MPIRCFSPDRLLGPNAAVRSWIGDLERRIHAELGRPALAQRFKSVLAVGAALWTGLTLKLDLFQHPKLQRTTYRMPDKRWSAFHLWEELQRKVSIPDFSVRSNCNTRRNKSGCGWKARFRQRTRRDWASAFAIPWRAAKAASCLDLNKLHWDKVDDLRPLREKLAAYRSRIRLVLPKLSAAHPELMLLASMFHHY